MLTTKLTGEQMREKVNMIRVARVGFDGLSCYLFLSDGTSIEIRSEIGSEASCTVLEFYHRLVEPSDPTSDLTNSSDNEGIKEGSKIE